MHTAYKVDDRSDFLPWRQSSDETYDGASQEVGSIVNALIETGELVGRPVARINHGFNNIVGIHGYND